MLDCVIKFDGKDYVPVRAIPAVTFDRFDPFAVTKLLGGEDRFIFARSYHVETTGLIEASPLAWRAQKNTQHRLRQERASDLDMIKALPAGMLVPLDELTKVLFDAFIEPALTRTPSDDALVSDPAFLTEPCTRLFLDSVTYDLVMEGMPKSLAPTETHETPAAESLTADSAGKNEGQKPWLIADPSDPTPEQSWYTPARYFARQQVKSDPTLLLKRSVLAQKVGGMLTAAGIKKRGGRKPLDANTVLKAFVNVSLG